MSFEFTVQAEEVAHVPLKGRSASKGSRSIVANVIPASDFYVTEDGI